MRAREARYGDADAIAAIYNAGIAERTATFETRPRTPDEVRAWFDGRHPIVAVEEPGGQVISFAAARHARLDGEWRDVGIVERLLGEAREP